METIKKNLEHTRQNGNVCTWPRPFNSSISNEKLIDVGS